MELSKVDEKVIGDTRCEKVKVIDERKRQKGNRGWDVESW